MRGERTDSSSRPGREAGSPEEIETLRRSEARFRRLVETDPNAIIVHRGDRIIYANPAACELVGARGAGDLLGRRIDELVAEEFRERVRERVRRVLEGGETAPLVEETLLRLDGSRFEAEVMGVPTEHEGQPAVHVFVRDISARKGAERALRESERRLRDFFDNAPDMFASVNVGDATIERCNRALSSRLGYAEGELAGRPVLELYDPSCHEAARAALREVVERGEVIHRELVMRRKDGSGLYVSLSATAERDERGEVVRARSVARDITAQVLRTTRMRDEARIQDAIGATDVPLERVLALVTETVEHQRPEMMSSILLLDERGERLLHGAAPSLPQDYNRAIDGLAIGPRAGSCGTAAFRGERVVVTDIATDPLWEDFRALAARHGLSSCWSEPVKSTEGRVLGTFALYYHEPRAPSREDLELIEAMARLTRNAIEHKRAGATARRLLSLIELTSDFVAIADSRGRVVYINPAGRALLGRSPASKRMTYRDFFPAAEGRRILHEVVPGLRHGGPWRGECLLRDRDGGQIPTSMVFVAHLGADGRPSHYSAIARDMRHERELRARIEHAQRLESLGVLAGGIAHDFNNLLGVILGHAGLARRKLGAGAPARAHLERIAESSQRAAELCAKMLAYAGKGVLTEAPLDLSRLAVEVTELLDVSIPKDVVVRLEPAPGAPVVDADVGQMRQVMMNLVLNAAEACAADGGTVVLATGVVTVEGTPATLDAAGTELPAGRYAFIRVSDTGCGMSRKTLEQIYDPFFSTKFAGRGLGMSVVHGMVRAHRGAIEISSEPGHGTSVNVLLPASRARPAPDGEEPARPVDDWRGTGTILVVDDEASLREMAAAILEAAGFEILTAADGAEAVAVYAEHAREVVAVLLDMTMPRMDGRRALGELKRIDPAVTVIASSGYGAGEVGERLGADRPAAFVQKPYTPEELLGAVRHAMTSQR